MAKIRVGLIGCGGRMNSHIEGLTTFDDVEIAAVADPHTDRAENAAKRTGAKKIYKDHNELLDNAKTDRLDCVVIAVEPTAHTDIEERTIELGLHFIIEKPMTLNLAQADDICRRIKEKGLVTEVGFQDRYLDLMLAVKDELPKHKAGGLVYGAWIGGIPGVWWWQKKSTCGGQLVEQNIHIADGLRFLYGEPLSVYATCSKGIVEPGVDASEEYDTDDHSTAVFRFKNNVTATLVSGCYTRDTNPSNGLHIVLNDLVLDYHLRDHLIWKNNWETRTIRRKNNQTTDLDRAFIDAVKAGDPSLPASPYEDALKTLRMCFTANASMKTGKVIYFDE